MGKVELVRVSVENLRGYYNTALSLKRPRTLLVGPNNAGKTSILRLISWAINDLEESLVEQRRPMTPDEEQLLLPARDARHRARRLTFHLRIADGRSHRKFGCDQDGMTTLRFNVRLTPQKTVYLALGSPKRGESATSDEAAVELLSRLRKSIRFVHIPSFRDAKSEKFNRTLHGALRSRIEERALHSAQSGAPREHREVAKKLEELEKVLLDLANPLWSDVSERLPPGMARDAVLDFNCDQATFLNFLESRLRLRISTGEHDALAVPMAELGSGLQSLLDLAFQDATPSETDVLMAVEEPEAFLHPAAQRTVTTQLLGSAGGKRRVILTTHSPIVVEEARFGEVVLCRNHKFFEPATVPDEARKEINTALLSGFGAEMVFGRAILLVEGEGDQQFFERLRRRLARLDESGEVDQCFVVPVGSSSRFGPWLRLLSAYGDAGDRPVHWLAVPDGDAGTEIRRGFRDAGMPLDQQVGERLTHVSESMNEGDRNTWRNEVRVVNQLCDKLDSSLHLLELDLEEAALGKASPETLDRISAAAGWEDSPDRATVLARLGSKGYGSGDGKKAPYLRALAGEVIQPDEITPCMRKCLLRWLSLAKGRAEAETLLRRWRGSVLSGSS